MLANERKSAQSQKDGDGSLIFTSPPEKGVQTTQLQLDGRHTKHAAESKAPADDLEHMHGPPKRRRTSSWGKDNIGTSLGRLEDIKRSFLDRATRIDVEPDPLNHTRAKPTKTHEAALQYSDDVIGQLLLSELPGSLNDTGQCSQPSSETQISVSDSAFDSPSSPKQDLAETSGKIQRRKEAYQAVKESFDGSRVGDLGLICRYDGCDEEEIEL